MALFLPSALPTLADDQPGHCDRPSHASFRSLGKLTGAHNVTLTGQTADRELTFRLGPTASQGPKWWYLLRLRGTAWVDSAHRGNYVLSVTTNDRTSAQFEIKFEPGIGWVSDALGLVSGSTRHRERDGKIQLALTNFVRLSGVKPGTNRLGFVLSPVYGQGVRRVRFGNRSGLIRTLAKEDEIAIDADDAVVEAGVGDSFEIPVSIRRRGFQPDRPVTVTLSAVGPAAHALDPEGAVSRLFQSVGCGRDMSFELAAKRTGSYAVEVQASTFNQPRDAIRVVVGKKERRISVLALLGAAGVLASLVGLARVLRRTDEPR